MQRLFSLFPHGAPGIGLILLRVAVCVGLLLLDPASLIATSSAAIRWSILVVAASLLTGLLTPWSALACCVSAIAVLARTEQPASSLIVLIFGLSAAALMLLGPGAYSLDAVLFGRRRIRLRD